MEAAVALATTTIRSTRPTRLRASGAEYAAVALATTTIHSFRRAGIRVHESPRADQEEAVSS